MAYAINSSALSDALGRLFWGLLISAPFCWMIYVQLRKSFRTRVKANSVSSVSSFFELQDFTNSTNLQAYSRLYGFAFAVILWIGFGSLCISEKVGSSMSAELVRILETFSKIQGIQTFTSFVERLPTPLALLLAALIVTIVFFPHIAAAMKILREFAQTAIGFDSTCDRLVNVAASETIQKYSFTDLQKQFPGHPALPREYTNEDDRKKIEFLILEAATETAAIDGLLGALQSVLRRAGIQSRLDGYNLSVIRLSGVVVIIATYFVAAVAYCAFAPFLGHYWCGDADCYLPVLGTFAFPNYQAGTEKTAVLANLVMEMSQVSLQIVFPFLIGLVLFARRRKCVANIGRGEADFLPVASFQILASIGFGVLFQIVTVIYSGVVGHPLPIFKLQRLLDAILPCLVAPSLTLLWAKMEPRGRYRAFAVFPLAIAGGLTYALIGLCYDCLKPEGLWVFIDGGVLATYLILICGALWAFIYVDDAEPDPDDKPNLRRAFHAQGQLPVVAALPQAP